MEYLEFESSIREIDEQIAKAKALESESGVEMSDGLNELESKLMLAQTDLKKNLTLIIGELLPFMGHIQKEVFLRI